VCTDESGDDIAHLSWDAITGELHSVGHRFVRTHTAQSALTRREALIETKQWLRKLGISRLSPYWQMEGEPRHWEDAWTVRWKSDTRMAYVCIGARDGELRHALSWRIPPRPAGVVPDAPEARAPAG